MEMNYYLNNINDGEIVLILNSSYNKQINISKESIKSNLLQMASEYRIVKVFNMLGIDKKVLSLSIKDVSNLEKTLVKIAYQLLKNKYLILNYLDVTLNNKEKTYLKRLLNKLSHEYKIKTIIFTNDMEFCFKLVDKVFVTKDKEIKAIYFKDFYNLELYNYIDMPNIIEFVLRSQKKGKKLDNYIEVSELLKGIYRL